MRQLALVLVFLRSVDSNVDASVFVDQTDSSERDRLDDNIVAKNRLKNCKFKKSFLKLTHCLTPNTRIVAYSQ